MNFDNNPPHLKLVREMFSEHVISLHVNSGCSPSSPGVTPCYFFHIAISSPRRTNMRL